MTISVKISEAAEYGSFQIGNAVTLEVGQLVQLTSGRLAGWDTTGQFLGILIGGDDRLKDGVLTGNTSDAIPPRGRVQYGALLRNVAVAGTPSATSVGALVYANAGSDPTANLTITDAADAPVGWLKDFRSASDCDVQLFRPGEWKAGVASGTWIA